MKDMRRSKDRSLRSLIRRAMATAAAYVLIATMSPAAATAGGTAVGPENGRPVVLLHGLIRSPRSMSSISRALEDEGYRVCNIGYPSRHHTIEVLAQEYVAPAIRDCFPDRPRPIDFVTHSMGGIVVRQLAAAGALPEIGRVVMLGPPNAGSEIVDAMGSWWLFRAINGPAGGELGTSPESVPCRLGPARFEVGVIAGNRTRNWLLSRYLPGENDGKVSVARAALQGMKDFVVIEANHTFMVRDDEAIAQTLHFLRDGLFERDMVVVAAEQPAPVF
jgi:triacylglycerol lipase